MLDWVRVVLAHRLVALLSGHPPGSDYPTMATPVSLVCLMGTSKKHTRVRRGSILKLLQERPMHAAEIAAHLWVSKDLVYFDLLTLEKKGLVRKEKGRCFLAKRISPLPLSLPSCPRFLIRLKTLPALIMLYLAEVDVWLTINQLGTHPMMIKTLVHEGLLEYKVVIESSNVKLVYRLNPRWRTEPWVIGLRDV